MNQRSSILRISRRQALSGFANGFGLLALAGMLRAQETSPLLRRSAPFPARARRVIFVFLSGGPSHVDLFDPKPRLKAEDGRPLPFPMPALERTRTGNLLASPFQFRRYGECGMELSELLPGVGSCADDLCLLRSMVTDNINHNGACLQMNTGEQAFSRPSLGSWLVYGLGTENQNLPGFVVISPAQPAQGAPLWSSSFLPAAFQGTLVSDLAHPIANLRNESWPTDQQRRDLDALRRLNEIHRATRSGDDRLEARIESFELAFRMQCEAPEALDVERESPQTKQLYGLGEPVTDIFGRQCLLARRLVERGVRFVQVYHTQTAHRSSCQLWDQHGGLRAELRNNCAAVDRPLAALIKDLKAQGLLNDTLVICGGEFGRTPTAESQDGREHHPFGFSMFLAGGGVRGGLVHGATDEYGWNAVEDKVHVHDLHATILHLLGIDHERLTYHYAGRDYRLTDVYGNVVQGILA